MPLSWPAGRASAVVPASVPLGPACPSRSEGAPSCLSWLPLPPVIRRGSSLLSAPRRRSIGAWSAWSCGPSPAQQSTQDGKVSHKKLDGCTGCTPRKFCNSFGLKRLCAIASSAAPESGRSTHAMKLQRCSVRVQKVLNQAAPLRIPHAHIPYHAQMQELPCPRIPLGRAESCLGGIWGGLCRPAQPAGGPSRNRSMPKRLASAISICGRCPVGASSSSQSGGESAPMFW